MHRESHSATLACAPVHTELLVIKDPVGSAAHEAGRHMHQLASLAKLNGGASQTAGSTTGSARRARTPHTLSAQPMEW